MKIFSNNRDLMTDSNRDRLINISQVIKSYFILLGQGGQTKSKINMHLKHGFKTL